MKIPTILLVLLILFAINILTSFLWYSFVVKTNPPNVEVHADAGVLLMGSFADHYRKLGNESLRRVEHAAALYSRGSIGNIVCAGGARPQKNVFGSEMLKQALLEKGVASENIFVETESYDTKSNWHMARQLIETHNWKTVTVISSLLHIHRLKGIILKKAPNNFKLSFSPYSSKTFKNTTLALTPVDIWIQIQYEWIAYATHYLLPDAVYRYIVKTFRHSDVNSD